VTTTDLVAELAKKSGLVWVTYAGRDHAVWHEWVGDAVCVVSGGGEQSLPDIAQQQRVTVALRSRSTRALAAVVETRVEVVPPGSEHWDTVTTALRAGRLNLVDGATAVDRWAAGSVVVRLVPDAPASTPATIPDTLGHTAPRLSR
jgi:hypothetical protein